MSVTSQALRCCWTGVDLSLQLRTLVVNSSNEQRHSERARLQHDPIPKLASGPKQQPEHLEFELFAHHASLLLVRSLSKPEGEVADCLGARLDLDRLVVCERVVLKPRPVVRLAPDANGDWLPVVSLSASVAAAELT